MLSRLPLMLMLTLSYLLRPNRAWTLRRWSAISRSSHCASAWPTHREAETASYVQHYLASENDTSLVDAVQQVLNEKKASYSASQLIRLGAVWHLPAAKASHDKPRRVEWNNVEEQKISLDLGDYLRIHFHPRRFPAATKVDWSKKYDDGGPLVDINSPHYVIVDKPPLCPVHKTVDNGQENVASQLASYYDYIGSPQRLDQATSGLLVVATTKTFASYFASLLQHKTATQLKNAASTTADDLVPSNDSVHKGYRCLVGLVPPAEDASWSVQFSWKELRDLSSNKTLIRHYLEPSICAPKQFHAQIPDDADNPEAWQECLMRITSVSEPMSLQGNKASLKLQRALPVSSSCQAVVECECELLTGRTHQIRGQFSSLGFPLVGDDQYGGASENRSEENLLALQCSRLFFRRPRARSCDEKLIRSDEWAEYKLDRAWWTYHLEEYRQAMMQVTEKEATTGALDVSLIERAPPPTVSNAPARPELLPPRVQVSPGKNKYVMIRATHPNDEVVQWFVKSANPEECGGPYHGDVAQDLREWIQAAGYHARVIGGGRIDFDLEKQRAAVYGFSYGFGKAPGQHERAAALIEDHMEGVIATYDNTEGIY